MEWTGSGKGRGARTRDEVGGSAPEEEEEEASVHLRNQLSPASTASGTAADSQRPDRMPSSGYSKLGR